MIVTGLASTGRISPYEEPFGLVDGIQHLRVWLNVWRYSHSRQQWQGEWHFRLLQPPNCGKSEVLIKS